MLFLCIFEIQHNKGEKQADVNGVKTTYKYGLSTAQIANKTLFFSYINICILSILLSPYHLH